MTLFFRVLQHLLPDGRAWAPLDRGPLGRQLEHLLKGLMTGGPERARGALDAVWPEQFGATTTQLEEWEQELGIFPRSSEADRRADIADELRVEDAALEGGQSPGYLQEKLRARGFDVYVHEWWSSGPPYVARDPRDYAIMPPRGSVQCAAFGPTQPQCAGFIAPGVPVPGQHQCNDLMTTKPNYLVNKTGRNPPPIPDDPARWPYFLYVGGETFPDPAFVTGSRRDEFERLILKWRPTHLWIVMLINFTYGVFDGTFDESFD